MKIVVALEATLEYKARQEILRCALVASQPLQAPARRQRYKSRSAGRKLEIPKAQLGRFGEAARNERVAERGRSIDSDATKSER